MSLIIRVMLLVGLSLIFSGCEEGGVVSGRLVYTDRSNHLGEIDFTSDGGVRRFLYQGEGISTVSTLTEVDESRVIFDSCSMGNCDLKSLSLGDENVTHLREGRYPVYVRSHDSLFFFSDLEGVERWLVAAPLDDLSNVTKVAKAPIKSVKAGIVSQSMVTPVVPVSDEKVIFVGEDGWLWSYSFSNNVVARTKFKDCRPILWRKKESQLLCATWDMWEVFLLDLKSGYRMRLEELDDAHGFVYAEGSDSLVYGKMQPEYIILEAHDIFMYEFSSGKETRIYKDAYMAGGLWFD